MREEGFCGGGKRNAVRSLVPSIGSHEHARAKTSIVAYHVRSVKIKGRRVLVIRLLIIIFFKLELFESGGCVEWKEEFMG